MVTEPRRSEAGFSLPELLAAITILGLIMSVMSSAFILGLRTTDEASTRLGNSFDAQLVTRYFISDVQSATFSEASTDSGYTLHTGCADSSEDVLRLVSASETGPGVAVRYQLRTTGAVKELVRQRCDFSVSATPTSTVVAHDLGGATASAAGGHVDLVLTTSSGPEWTVSGQSRPGRSLGITVPALKLLEIRDDDGDGFVEEVRATFNVEIACAGTCSTAAWTLLGTTPSGATLASVSVSGKVASLVLAGHSTTQVTHVPADFSVTLTEGVGGIEHASTSVSFDAVQPADGAAPVVTGIGMLDVDADGRVDRLDAMFTEPLDTSTDAAAWTLSGVPSGGTRGTVSTSGATAQLLMTEGSGDVDTSVGSLAISLDKSATGIRDPVGNEASFADVAPTDKAGPVAVAIASGNGNGIAELGDTISITFSEALAPLTATTSDVILAAANGNNKPVILTMPNVAAGGFAIGETPGYIDRNSNDVSFANSVVTMSDASTLVIILSAPSGGTRTVGGYVAGAAGTYAPATAVRDAAGNQAAGSLPVTVGFF